MKRVNLIIIVLTLFLGACAQVPREAVELSATVGRDLAEMRKSHIALVDLYYLELISDINKFVDNVYLPFQIQATLSDDIFKIEILNAIETASRADPTGEAQKDSIQKIEIFLQTIHEEVESYRKLKLGPVKKQYADVSTKINNSYEQIHYANSIVTGHLASVVKVHESQEEILSKLDLKDLRTNIGKGVAGVSDEIGQLVQKARHGEERLDIIVDKFDNLLMN
jgi:hypothetical protein